MQPQLFPGPVTGPAGLRPLARALELLDTLTCWVICISVALMVAVVSAQVAMRYGLNRSFDWADEVSRLCFVWSIFLAIPLGIRARAHIGVEVLVARLPAGARGALARAVALVSAALLLLVAWEAAVMSVDQWDETMASVPASAAWFNVPLVWLGVHGALHLLWSAAFAAPAADASTPEELA